MGVYNTINKPNNDIQVEATEGYHGEIGVQLAMIESYENDLNLFNNTIMDDFKEATMVKKGASIEEIQIIREGTMSNFIDRIKEFFIKLWKKIKGIFESFIAKFDSLVMRDNKAFYDKYWKVVDNKDISKMKAKYSKQKYTGDFVFNIGGYAAKANTPCLNVGMLSRANVQELSDNFDRDDFISEILKRCKPEISCTPNEYEKEFHEAVFEDEDEVEGFESIKKEMAAILSGKTDPVVEVKKANTSLEKTIKEIISSIEKSKSDISSAFISDSKSADRDVRYKQAFGVNKTDKDGEDSYKDSSNKSTMHSGSSSDSSQKIQKSLGYIHTQATAIQSAAGLFTSASLRETKFKVAQARRIFAAIVAYHPVKEDTDLMNAVQEAAEWEVMSDFD